MSNQILTYIQSCKPYLAEETYRSLKEQAKGDRVDLLVTGVTSSGKSTLINALLGENILPTGTLPLTSIILLLIHGKKPNLVCHYKNEKPRKLRFDDLTKINNIPKAQLKKIDYLDAAYPFDNNFKKLCLIDTPGSDSLRSEHTVILNRALNLADAILYVSNYNQPPTAVEYKNIQDIYRKVPYIFWIVNKTDRGSLDIMSFPTPDEILEYKQSILQDCEDYNIKLQSQPLFVSALAHINAAHNNDDDLRNKNYVYQIYDIVFRKLETQSNYLSGYATVNSLKEHMGSQLKAKKLEIHKHEKEAKKAIEKAQGVYSKYLSDDGLLQNRIQQLFDVKEALFSNCTEALSSQYDKFLDDLIDALYCAGYKQAEQYSSSLDVFETINEERAEYFVNNYLKPQLEEKLNRFSVDFEAATVDFCKNIQRVVHDYIQPVLGEAQKELNELTRVAKLAKREKIKMDSFNFDPEANWDADLGKGLTKAIGGIIAGGIIAKSVIALAIPVVGWIVGIFGLMLGAFEIYGNKAEKLRKVVNNLVKMIEMSMIQKKEYLFEKLTKRMDEIVKNQLSKLVQKSRKKHKAALDNLKLIQKRHRREGTLLNKEEKRLMSLKKSIESHMNEVFP